MFSNRTLKLMFLLNVLDQAGCTLFVEDLQESLDVSVSDLNSMGRAMAEAGVINYSERLGAFTLIKDLWEISFDDIVAFEAKNNNNRIKNMVKEFADKVNVLEYVDVMSFFYAVGGRNKHICH